MAEYRNINWSIFNLEEDYKTNRINDLINKYNLPKHFIVKRIQELGLRKRSDYWTKEEIELAKKGIVPPGRTYKATNCKRVKEGYTRKLTTREWSEQEIKVLKQNWNNKSNEEIARLLNRTRQSVQNKKVKLNLVADRTWSDTEIDILKGCTNITECIERLPNRTEYAIKHMINRLGISFDSKRFSQIHQKVCLELRKLGLVYTIEHKIDKYFIDCYLPELKICIEVDGSYWHSDKDIRDKEKNKYLEEQGFKLIRISEEEANNSQIVKTKIIKNIVNCWKLLCKDNQQPS